MRTAGDFEGLPIMAHHLKSSGQSYGLSDLARLGRALDESAKNADARAVQELPEKLGDCLQRVQLEPEISSGTAHKGVTALNPAPASADV